MGRLREAWRTLLGRGDVQIRAHAKLARIEAEWAEICTSIEETMLQLNLASDRLRKQKERREKAAAKLAASTPAASDGDAAPPPQLHGRALVLHELRRKGRPTSPAQLAKPNGDEG